MYIDLAKVRMAIYVWLDDGKVSRTWNECRRAIRCVCTFASINVEITTEDDSFYVVSHHFRDCVDSDIQL